MCFFIPATVPHMSNENTLVGYDVVDFTAQIILGLYL